MILEDILLAQHPKNYFSGPGAVAHACNPSTLKGQGGVFETSLTNVVKLSLLKIQKSGVVAHACSPNCSGG